MNVVMDKKYIFLRTLVLLVLMLCAAMSFAQTNLPNVVDTEPNGLPLLLVALGGIFCLRARKSAGAYAPPVVANM